LQKSVAKPDDASDDIRRLKTSLKKEESDFKINEEFR